MIGIGWVSSKKGLIPVIFLAVQKNWFGFYGDNHTKASMKEPVHRICASALWQVYNPAPLG
jgi:hypothetical protein